MYLLLNFLGPIHNLLLSPISLILSSRGKNVFLSMHDVTYYYKLCAISCMVIYNNMIPLCVIFCYHLKMNLYYSSPRLRQLRTCFLVRVAHVLHNWVITRCLSDVNHTCNPTSFGFHAYSRTCAGPISFVSCIPLHCHHTRTRVAFSPPGAGLSLFCSTCAVVYHGTICDVTKFLNDCKYQ